MWNITRGHRGLTWLALAMAATFLLAACGGSDSEASTERPANPAPEFELSLFGNDNHQKGEAFRLSQVEGPAVVNFWFPSCPPCVAEMPDIDAAYRMHEAHGLEFVGIQLIGLDTAADGQDFIDEIGVTYAVGPDETGDIVKDYKVTGFPSTVFIDEDQNIVRKWTGFLNAEKIEELIQELLN